MADGDDHADRLEPSRGEAHERARKIDPSYAEGDLVRVAWAANQAEAELIQGMLLEGGIPSTVRRTMGFDVPDFLAAGPRDVYVPVSGVEAARELLPEPADAAAPAAAAGGQVGRGLRIGAVVVAAGGLAALLAWLLQSAA